MTRPLRFKMEKDLQLIIGLSVLQIFAVTFLPDTPIRTLIGVPLVLFFPGYVLVCALYPKKKDLEIVERVALSIGLSLAVVPLIGLVLNYTPWGIRLYPVLFSLFLFTLSMSMATTYRRKGLPVEEKFVPSVSVKVPKWRGISRTHRIMLAGFLVFAVVAGGLTAYFASMSGVGERFTGFYVLGPEGKMEGYPKNLTLGESGTVILGLANYEYQEVTYNIVIKLENATIGTINNVRIAHEETWQQNFTFTPEEVGEKMKLEFLLYADLDGVDAPYQSLHLSIAVKPRD